MKTTTTNKKIQLIKFGIGIVAGGAIYLIVNTLF